MTLSDLSLPPPPPPSDIYIYWYIYMCVGIRGGVACDLQRPRPLDASREFFFNFFSWEM